jgi:hypothetical protein
MMHGIENAAGYDGFGIARYGRLAGDMKVWGELTDPNRTLRGPSREIDLLNVRYLLSMRRRIGAHDLSETPTTFDPANTDFGGSLFAARDLGFPGVSSGQRLMFSVPPVEADRITLVTNLAWSQDVPDGAVVARLRLEAIDGRIIELPLRAGPDTAEWSFDRPDIRAQIRHNRAPVAMSYAVKDAQGEFKAHSYVASLPLPNKIKIKGGEMAVERFAQSPNFSINIQRVSLMDGSRAYPLRTEWVKVGQQTEEIALAEQHPAAADKVDNRWRLVGQTEWVDIFENARPLPRAWLATSEVVLTSMQELEVIRTGKLPGGEAWDPLQTGLVEAATGVNFSGAQSGTRRAEVTHQEPNRFQVKTSATTPTLLILSENYFPGWRAYVDGRAVETLRVNYNLRGVALEAGDHAVEFLYRPYSVIAGAIISLLTLAGLLLLRLVPPYKRPRPKENKGSIHEQTRRHTNVF